jgi:hypothetical protein
MNASDLKLKIIREIDSLDKSKLEDFYGVLVNFVNGQKDLSEWEELTNDQRQGILDAVSQVESGEIISHDKIVAKYSNKYSNA